MKRNIYVFMVLSLTLALSSCKIGKKYARPELDLPEELWQGRIPLRSTAFLGRACMPIRLCSA